MQLAAAEGSSVSEGKKLIEKQEKGRPFHMYHSVFAVIELQIRE